MPESLSGATRVHVIVGDPIAQVKSPAGVTRSLRERGLDAVVVPAHVAADDLDAWLAGVSRARNVDGIIVTVPHKFACLAHCASASDRATFLGAVNVMRRRRDGGWDGDMFDGLGFVQALRDRGADPAGARALIAGAGGAGTAIAHALVCEGLAGLVVHDADPDRRRRLVERLAGLGRCPVREGGADPAGFDLVVNATPAGMRPGDPLPLDANRLEPGQVAACVVTAPAVSPFIAVARERGCRTSTGIDMFERVRDRLVDFLATPSAR